MTGFHEEVQRIGRVIHPFSTKEHRDPPQPSVVASLSLSAATFCQGGF